MNSRCAGRSQKMSPAQLPIIARDFLARKDITDRDRRPGLELIVWLFGMIGDMPVLSSGALAG